MIILTITSYFDHDLDTSGFGSFSNLIGQCTSDPSLWNVTGSCHGDQKRPGSSALVTERGKDSSLRNIWQFDRYCICEFCSV